MSMPNKDKIMKNCNNPNFRPQAVYVIYDPETDAYMTARVRIRNCGPSIAYWAKDVRKALYYSDKSRAYNTMTALKRDGHGKLEIKVLDD